MAFGQVTSQFLCVQYDGHEEEDERHEDYDDDHADNNEDDDEDHNTDYHDYHDHYNQQGFACNHGIAKTPTERYTY